MAFNFLGGPTNVSRYTNGQGQQTFGLPDAMKLGANFLINRVSQLQQRAANKYNSGSSGYAAGGASQAQNAGRLSQSLHANVTQPSHENVQRIYGPSTQQLWAETNANRGSSRGSSGGGPGNMLGAGAALLAPAIQALGNAAGAFFGGVQPSTSAVNLNYNGPDYTSYVNSLGFGSGGGAGGPAGPATGAAANGARGFHWPSGYNTFTGQSGYMWDYGPAAGRFVAGEGLVDPRDVLRSPAGDLIPFAVRQDIFRGPQRLPFGATHR